MTNKQKRTSLLILALFWAAAGIICPLFIPVAYIGSLPLTTVVVIWNLSRRARIPYDDQPYSGF
jgi:hypothetical protein